MSDIEMLALAIGLVIFLMIHVWVRSLDHKIKFYALVFGPAWVWAFALSGMLFFMAYKSPPALRLDFIACGTFLAMLGALFLLAWESARHEASD